MKRRKNTILSKINLKFKIHTIETTKYRLSSPKVNDCVCSRRSLRHRSLIMRLSWRDKVTTKPQQRRLNESISGVRLSGQRRQL